ncbi:Phosphoribosylformylglycinamidine cyclo-ligase [Trichinella spiralis]|uniref:Phosphoribosylformylglycinamidine cyclo-ligase n=1 Tax=Trichinella spiralis TaxID=6334 RepID=A0ABR3K6B3_TRISP
MPKESRLSVCNNSAPDSVVGLISILLPPTGRRQIFCPQARTLSNASPNGVTVQFNCTVQNIITASLAAVLSSSVQLYNVKTSKLYDHHNWLLASIRDNANAVEGDAE